MHFDYIKMLFISIGLQHKICQTYKSTVGYQTETCLNINTPYIFLLKQCQTLPKNPEIHFLPIPKKKLKLKTNTYKYLIRILSSHKPQIKLSMIYHFPKPFTSSFEINFQLSDSYSPNNTANHILRQIEESYYQVRLPLEK